MAVPFKAECKRALNEQQHGSASGHLDFSEEEAELEGCPGSKLSAARPGKRKARLLSPAPPHQFPSHQNALAFGQAAVALGESDVYSDICINAFPTTAFCLPNHNRKVE